VKEKNYKGSRQDSTKTNGNFDGKKKKDNQEEEKIEIETRETEEKKLMQFKFRDLGRSRHWSDKATNLMTERDWRIFREVINQNFIFL